MGAATVLGGAGAANASHAGATDSFLSSSNGSYSINFSGRSALASEFKIKDASWSPDGSQAVFVDEYGQLDSIRYNDSSYLFVVADSEADVQRADPSYVGDGSSVVYAAKKGSGRWQIEAIASNGLGATKWVVSNQNDGYHYFNPDAGDVYPGTGLTMSVVVQRQADDGTGAPTGAPEIGFLASNGTFTPITTNAANPAISPDGTKVAFVRDGQIWVTDTAGNNPVQVTSNTAGHDNPTWSPDGTKIAFTQDAGVATAPANGSGAASPTLVSGLSGVPAYQPKNKERVVRLGGSNRFGTAAAVSQSHWKTNGNASDTRAQAQAVVLSRADNFADALGGSALAAAKVGPLLLTPVTALDASTQAEIQRVLAPGGMVYLLGGTGALSTAVESKILSLGYKVTRLSGANRYETSVKIAKAINPTPDLILAATGQNFPDALAAGAAAGSYNVPGFNSSAVVVLTDDRNLPAATKAFLDSTPSSDIFTIGGQADVALMAYNHNYIIGSNRYETADFTGEVFFGGQNYMGLATGTNWPDALSGGALMATLNGPLMLTPGNDATFGADAQYLAAYTSGSVHTGLVFGSTGAVNSTQLNGLGAWIGGPAGFTAQTNATDVYRVDAAGTQAGIARQAGAQPTGGGHRSLAELDAAYKAYQEQHKK